MNFPELLAYAGGAFCGGLALVVLLSRPRALEQWCFVGGMLLLAVESVFSGLSLATTLPEEMVHWWKLKLVASALLPGIWLLFSLCYARGNYREFLARWWPVVALALVLGIALALGFSDALVTRAGRSILTDNWILVLGWSGVVLKLVYLLSAILILMNLERTFRAAVGTMRWRIKFMVLGLAVLFGVRIYTRSQVLLFAVVTPSLAIIDASALCVACLLIAYSLLRSKPSQVEIYPSQAVLQRSLTAVLAGAYLFIVGVLDKVVGVLGGDESLPLQAFLVMAALVFLGILLFSDRLQQQTKRFISRHFRRPLHDYRQVWTAFTERTSSWLDEPGFCRVVARLVSDTFNVLSVTVWLADADRQKMEFAASTSLSEAQANQLLDLMPNQNELIRSMRKHPHPVDLNESKEDWVETWKRCNPATFETAPSRVCVPLVSGGELLGVLTLGDRVRGLPFSVEDFDLLKCIGDQVAASLRNIKLSQRLLQAKEMEAFQTMSAFFVHDLKNTASTLSLMLRNMEVHFQDPGFREDALRGLSKSVAHINELISRLSTLRQKSEMKKVESDLNEVVTAALATVETPPEVRLVKDLRPLPRLAMDPEQMQKVVANLVLNAKDAVGSRGEIRLETDQHDGWAVLAVADNGCGMSPDFLARSLFKPFQTTKQKGLGIGMYHTKTIVEAHQGRIDVESEPGKGTTFRVLLPLPS